MGIELWNEDNTNIFMGELVEAIKVVADKHNVILSNAGVVDNPDELSTVFNFVAIGNQDVENLGTEAIIIPFPGS